MHEPLWKRLLSYLVEMHIESVESDHNPNLYVSLRQGRYQLCTEHAVYSYGDLYTNFFDAFARVKLQDLPGDQVLVLGLGLGSIPQMLEKNFRKSYNYTLVEIDEAVIELAQKYVLYELASTTFTITGDAATVVEQLDGSFAMICMDVFLDDSIPQKFESREFLEQLQRLLSPGGLLLFNRLALNASDRKQARAYYENIFRDVFPRSYLIDVKTNFILINERDYISG